MSPYLAPDVYVGPTSGFVSTERNSLPVPGVNSTVIDGLVSFRLRYHVQFLAPEIQASAKIASNQYRAHLEKNWSI